MTNSSFRRLAYSFMAGLILFSMIFAIAANNVAPVTYLTDQSSLVTAIRQCPTTGGACPGTDPDASELVIGSPAIDDIQSGKGDDCILGGGGNDNMRGEQNTDVCIGGSGTDSFHPSCETQTQ